MEQAQEEEQRVRESKRENPSSTLGVGHRAQDRA